MNLTGTVQRQGASIWLEWSRRGSIAPGELPELIEQRGLDGLVLDLVSEPHERTGESLQKRETRRLSQLGLSSAEIYSRLEVQDIRLLVDLLLPFFEHSNGSRGLVSVPLLGIAGAQPGDFSATAQELCRTINRPNLIVAVPFTPSGLDAFEGCLELGLNVEIRSLSTLDEFNLVRQLHHQALHRLANRGRAVGHIVAVASIDMAAIDRVIDEQLDQASAANGSRSERGNLLRSRAALATADLVLAQQEVDVAGMQPLPDGAQTLHVRWADLKGDEVSLPEGYYLEPLMDSASILTITVELVDALERARKSLQPREADLSVSRGLIEAIGNLGISVEAVLAEARDRAIEAALQRKQKALGTLEERIRAYRDELGGLEGEVLEALASSQAREINRRIWDGERMAGRDHPNWLGLPQVMATRARELAGEVAKDIGAGQFEALVVAGAFEQTFPLQLLKERNTSALNLDVRILNRLDPIECRNSLKDLHPEKTCVLILDWDGSQIEAGYLLTYLWGWIESNPALETGEHFMALAWPGSKLSAIAQTRGFRSTYSYETPVVDAYGSLGLESVLPALMAGIDYASVLTGSREMIQRCSLSMQTEEHPGLYLAAVITAMQASGHERLTLVCDSAALPFWRWLAELLDLSSRGLPGSWVVIPEESPGTGKHYDGSRAFIYLRVNGELDKKCEGWVKAGIPVLVFQTDCTGAEVGGAMLAWQYAVAAALKVLDVDLASSRHRLDLGRAIQSLLRSWERKGEFEGAAASAGREAMKIISQLGIALPEDPPIPAMWAEVLNHAGKLGGLRMNFFSHLPSGLRKKLGRIQRTLRDRHQLWSTIREGRLPLTRAGERADRAFELIVSVRETKDLSIPGSTETFNTVQRARARVGQRFAGGRGVPSLHVEMQDDRALKLFVDALATHLKGSPDGGGGKAGAR